MAVGDFSGGMTADIAIGASAFGARIYKGSTGALFDVLPVSSYGLASGDFNGDGSADLAVMDSASDIHMFEFVGGGSITLDFEAGTVREFFAGDLYNNDNVDEVVVDLERYGAIAYSFTGTEVWRYNAPLVLGGKDTRILLENMNADGWTDLVLSNKEYINVVDGSTALLLWHYWRQDVTTNANPRIGHFYSMSGRDVLCYGGASTYVVAHDAIAPKVPLSAPLFQTKAVLAPPDSVFLIVSACCLILLIVTPHRKAVPTRKKWRDME